MKSIGLGLATNMERAAALVAHSEGKQPRFEEEILAFIRRPELRSVAESLLSNCVPSFSRATALRKLLEADEALMRALAIDLAAREAGEAKPSGDGDEG